MLIRRLPRLHQVVVQLDFVDRVDGRGRVGVRREQHAACFRLQRDRLVQELGAAHLRHSLIDEKERNAVATRGQLTDGVDGLLRRIDREDPIVRRELRLEIAFDGAQDRERRRRWRRCRASSFAEGALDGGHEIGGFRVHIRFEALQHFTLPVDEDLREVPLNVAARLAG